MDADDFFGVNGVNHFMDSLFTGMARSMNVYDIGEGISESLVSGIDGNLRRILVVAIP